MSQLVMIVDDEPGILNTLSGVLNDQGYQTITTPSGTYAPELYRESRNDRIALVADPKRVRALGWEPDYPLERTLSDLLDDWRERV